MIVQVRKDCVIWFADTIVPTSGTVEIDLAGLADGEYEVLGSSPNCEGFAQSTFLVTHNEGGIEPGDEVTENKPLAVPSLSAAAVDGDTIRLNWSHPGGAYDFKTQISEDGIAFDDLSGGVITGTLRTTDVNSLTTGTRYYFRIQARLADGTFSAFSNIVSAIPTEEVEVPHARKVLLHNQTEWDFIILSNNDARIAEIMDSDNVPTHVTILLQWWDYEPQKDVYDFTKFDAAVEYFESKGLKSLVQIPYRFAYDGMLNASSHAYIPTSAAILLRSGNRALSNIEGAVGSKANPFYADRQAKLAARIADHINSDPFLKENAQQALFIDGASNETGLFTGSFEGNIDDGDWNNSTNVDFQMFLQSPDMYNGNIGALNTAWTRSFPTFHAISRGDYQPTLYSGSYIGYSENQRTKDWFEYLCASHKLFYRRIIAALKNPQGEDPTLSSTNTGIQTVCYWTEPYTGQGIFWGSGIPNMLSEFDIVFSSRGASDGPHVGGNHLVAFAQAVAVMLGTFPNQICGVEMDSDILFANGHRIGPSRLARCIFAAGAEWMIYTFYDQTGTAVGDWNEGGYYSINGDTLTFKEDSELAIEEYIIGKTRTLPTPSQTLTFDLADVLANVADPGGVVADWLAAVAPDAEGLSSIHVFISMDEIL